MNNHKEFKVSEDILATPGKRIANFAIDMIAMSIILFIGLTIFLADKTVNEQKEFTDRFLMGNLLQVMVTCGITLVYYNFFEIATARTISKFCTNTIVVDEQGEKANYEAIMFRSLVRIIPLYWIFSIIFPKRGLHDLISKTYVVDKKKLEESKREFYNKP